LSRSTNCDIGKVEGGFVVERDGEGTALDLAELVARAWCTFYRLASNVKAKDCWSTLFEPTISSYSCKSFHCCGELTADLGFNTMPSTADAAMDAIEKYAKDFILLL
jgi:hypothetical protein